jgi:glycosyltransferase involved in cell wall biosynthesis
VLHLARDLQDLGWRVDLLAPDAPGAAAKEQLDGVAVERFRYFWPRRLQTVCYQGGALINLSKNPLNYAKLPALVAAELAAVVRRLATGHYDLLHTHWLLPQGYVGALAARRYGIPHVTTVHGGDVFALRGAVLRRFKRAAIRGADAVTANSSVTRRAVMELNAADIPVSRIPFGIDLDVPPRDAPEVRSVRNRYRRGRGPLLIFVGRLIEDKGVADLLSAVRLLHTRCDVTALIVGDGQDRAAFEREAAKLGVTDRVHFTGWVQNADVAGYIAAADAFISPSWRSSNGWVEAQGLAILEAMAVGTPVVATLEGGVVDSVKHMETGLLVEQRAPDQLAAAVLQLVRAPELSARLARDAQSNARRHFSRSSSAGAFSELFDRVLAQHGSR